MLRNILFTVAAATLVGAAFISGPATARSEAQAPCDCCVNCGCDDCVCEVAGCDNCCSDYCVDCDNEQETETAVTEGETACSSGCCSK